MSIDFLPTPAHPTWTVVFAADASFQAQAQCWGRQLQARWATSFAQIEWGTIRNPDDLIRGDTVVLFGPEDQLALTAEQIREQGRSVTLIDTNTNLSSSEQLQATGLMCLSAFASFVGCSSISARALRTCNHFDSI